MKISDEQWALAVEIFGGQSEANYMLVGAGLRRDCTLKLLDVLLATRRKLDNTEALARAERAERSHGIGTFADRGEIDPP